MVSQFDGEQLRIFEWKIDVDRVARFCVLIKAFRSRFSWRPEFSLFERRVARLTAYRRFLAAVTESLPLVAFISVIDYISETLNHFVLLTKPTIGRRKFQRAKPAAMQRATLPPVLPLLRENRLMLALLPIPRRRRNASTLLRQSARAGKFGRIFAAPA